VAQENLEIDVAPALMPADSFDLLGSTVTPVHIEHGAYSRLEWRPPAGAAKPPPHRHWHTDKGSCVARGRLKTQIDHGEAVYEERSLVQIKRRRWHTVWNPATTSEIPRDDHPTQSRGLFRQAGERLSAQPSPAEAQAFREELFARHDAEMKGLTRLNAQVHDQNRRETL
jgi:hypothetical protein